MGKNWAITIGIDKYRNLQDLSYAARDAEAMRDYFQKDLQFQEVYYFSDTSKPIPGDRGDLDSQPSFTSLNRFFRERFDQPFLKAGDNLWFFFSGHGSRHEDRDYLMPFDVDPVDLLRTAIPLSYITERLRRCGADNIVMLIDACRSGSGRRDGVGIGEEKQQGVITFFSCSSRESSYEIEGLQQGAFTYALLESLRIQGEGNCATVERLYQRLRNRVPELSRQYKMPIQTPYGSIEPPTRYHYILIPKQANDSDVLTLINEAQNAELNTQPQLAKQLWLRVLAVSPTNSQAIEGIERLARGTSPPQKEENKKPSVDENPPPKSSTSESSPDENKFSIPRRALITGVGVIGIAGAFKVIIDNNKPQDATNKEYGASSVPSSFIESTTEFTSKSFTFNVVKVDAKGKEIERNASTAQYFVEDLGKQVELAMVSIPEGTSLMGSPGSEKGRYKDESPQHKVTVPAFLMGRYPVTQAQWKIVAMMPQVERGLKADPSTFKGDNLPIESVSWDDAVEFCKRLTNHTNREYRLPSEAEWEYACRAGTATPFHFGETITTDLANYRGIDWKYESKTYPGFYGSGPRGEFRERTTPVDHFKIANAFGLSDMHGNVWEWCADLWHGNYNGAPMDGSSWLKDSKEEKYILRGGSWLYIPWGCRSAYRNRYARDGVYGSTGFRVCCSSPRSS
jgi:formylglycine-generating enzyme required for sulfatase activity/uncharacterized caspase-like protein